MSELDRTLEKYRALQKLCYKLEAENAKLREQVNRLQRQSELMRDVEDTARALVKKIESMPWCKFDSKEDSATCVDTSSWKNMLYVYLQPLQETLASVRELDSGETTQELDNA